mmetsp:Transcript_34164/g.69177  ORF Transcript_34164/g.69177 Transcript_34164/m.69177 type:complete len:478 (-) Transcript_34164:1736-3169(-)
MVQKLKTKEIHLKKTILKICLDQKKNSLMGIIQASRILFVSFKNFQLKGSIKGTRGFFLNGIFRKNFGNIFASSGKNKQIELFDVSNKRFLRSLKGHLEPVYSTNFSNDGLTLVSGGNDMLFKVWDISLQKCIVSYLSHQHFIRSVSFLPQSNQICGSSSYDGKIKLHDLRVKKGIISYWDHGCPIENFKFLPDRNTIVTIGGNFFKLWNIPERKCVFQVKETRPLLNVSVLSKRFIFYNSIGQEIHLFDNSSFSTYPLFCFEKEVLSLETSVKGLIIGFSDGKICYRNLVSDLKILLREKPYPLPKSPFFSTAQKTKNFFGFNPKKRSFFSKVFEIMKKKKSFAQKEKKKKVIKKPNLAGLIGNILKKKQKTHCFKKEIGLLKNIFISKVIIFIESITIFEVLTDLKLRESKNLCSFVASRIRFDVPPKIFSPLKKLFKKNLFFLIFNQKNVFKNFLFFLLRKKKKNKKKIYFLKN